MSLLKNEKFRSLALLGIVSALIYLPLVAKFGYTHDDWYLMYAAKVKGATIFREIFNGDRPLRASILIPAYYLFGENVLYYNLAAYFFRLLSGVGFLWSVRLLWRRERNATLWMAILFLLFPGFLSQPNGIDYQSQMVALAAATFSLALTIKAIFSQNLWKKAFYYMSSALLAWLYLGLVEYFMGIEALRFLILLVLVSRDESKWFLKLRRTFFESIPLFLVSLLFFYWRFFIFKSERGATDIDKQLSIFLSSPLEQILVWTEKLFQDMGRVFFGAWYTPISQLYHLPKSFTIIIQITFLLGILYFLYILLKDRKRVNRWQYEALFIGFLGLAFCQLPIVIVNREVLYPFFSRYALAGSLGVAMLIVAILSSIRIKWFRNIALLFLLLISAFTHYGNASQFALETASMNNFWWQVSWRAPHISERTTLLANYPVVSTEEDYFIWGPANQIYYPEGTNEKVVQPGIYAFIINDEAIEKILARERQEYSERRGIESYPNARNILILSQPTPESCVQVIDGFNPEYSSSEKADIMKVGEFSEVEHILTEAEFHTPPEIVFGPEPEHGWCYFYEKATLARQRGDWDEVRALDAEASQQGSVPKDLIEWMPFLQSYIHFNDLGRLTKIAKEIENNRFASDQACEILLGMPEISSDAAEIVDVKICYHP